MPYNALWNRIYTNYIASTCAEICASDEALRKTYARCRVYVDLPLLTRVPSALFDPDMLPVYFQPSPPTLLRHMTFFSEVTPGRSDVAVWGLPCSWTTMWQPLASTAVDWHHATTALFRTASESGRTVLMLYVSAASVAVMLQRDGELLHCNTYQVDSMTDVLYYAVGVLRKHNMQAAQCPVLCISSSASMPADDLVKVLKPYFPQVMCPWAVLPEQSPFREVRQAPIFMQPCE